MMENGLLPHPVGLLDCSQAAEPGRPRRDLLRALRQTLDLGGLHLHYQPIVDVSIGRVRAIECLARWNHKDLGTIAPATFIALAERNGEIERLGEWVLVRALSQATAFISKGAPTLAINVSATQIMAPGFLPHLEQCLAQNAVPPNTLELELTESALAGNVESLRDLLVEQVHELGVSLIQGFWFAKPMAAEKIADWIRNFEERAAMARNLSRS
jgi:EAL domain-containing protein (putative c-di-GMP-specific phosphodiesterase class I)